MRSDELARFQWTRESRELGGWIDARGVGEPEPGRWLPCALAYYDHDREETPERTEAVDRFTHSQLLRGSDPLDEPALFRTLADLQVTEAATEAFASRYGRLTLGEKIHPVCLLGTPGRLACTSAEPFELWADAIHLMRAGLTLWDSLKAGDGDAVAAQVRPRPDRLTLADGTPLHSIDWRVPTGRLFDRVAFGVCEPFPGPLLAAGWLALSRLVNAMLAAPSSIQLVSPDPYGMHPRPFGLRVVPPDLLGALWYQFARAVDGNRQYKRCDQCGLWFEVAPDVSRSDKRYCSSTCRSKAWRRRRDEARRGGRP